MSHLGSVKLKAIANPITNEAVLMNRNLRKKKNN
jgi:hypothetical protein